MDGVAIPHYFLCPISLEIMKDPVTVCTGITYDRESIEQWLFVHKNKSCPITRQPLFEYSDITPNHTLRRLIQAWCVVNAVERISTPKPPVDKARIIKLLEEAMNPKLQMASLHKLKLIASESERNKRLIEAAGAASILASIVRTNISSIEVALDDGVESSTASDEALAILHSLQFSEESLRDLIGINAEFVACLVLILQQRNDKSRTYSTFLLQSIVKVLDPVHLLCMRGELLQEIIHILRNQISPQTTKAALEILIQICPWGRNRIKAAKAGAVSIMIELLLGTYEKRTCEMILMVLDQLCRCAEGRAELISHGAGIAVVTKKLLRVSHVSTERALRILHSVATFSASSSVVQEMLQLGVVSQLCLLLQLDFGLKAKVKAKEILIRHSRAWKNSPCTPQNFLSSYPSQL